MSELKYSIVVATRNRVEALRLSLPRMLAQSVPPAQLIVVDSSDDHDPVVHAVREAVGNLPVQLTILRTERGLTLQRNRGLALVDEPIVFFPDDDSILFPEAAEAILAVYKRDISHAISAVCGMESSTPPDNFFTTAVTYSKSRNDRLKHRFSRIRSRIENRLFPDPGRILGRSFIAAAELPTWLPDVSAVPVEWMTGFRMSFRTDVIRRAKFDEALSRYCLFEDRDASFAAWKQGVVVAAQHAKIYHHRSPEKRDGGRRLGVEQILNQAYVTAKHTPVDHPSRKVLRRFARYKMLLYLMVARRGFEKDRYEGAKAATAVLRSIIDARQEDLPVIYALEMKRCLEKDRHAP